MRARKNTDLEKAEELGKVIIKRALDQKREILKKVDEDVLAELESFRASLPQESLGGGCQLDELERHVAVSKEQELNSVKEQLERNQDKIVEMLIQKITKVDLEPA